MILSIRVEHGTSSLEVRDSRFYKQSTITEFVDFFTNSLETYILSDREKRLLAKLIFAIRAYKDLVMNDNVFVLLGKDTKYKVVASRDINPSNPDKYFILIEIVDKDRGVVIDSGNFKDIVPDKLLNHYSIKDGKIKTFSIIVFDILEIVNDWIRENGNYLIPNPKDFDK